MALLDNALLQPLAQVCAEEGRYLFMLSNNPLVVIGGTGSPGEPHSRFLIPQADHRAFQHPHTDIRPLPKFPTSCYPPPMKELRDFLDSPPGPKDPPKGSFYDVKRKRGGQPRNRNARNNGLYSKHLPPEQLQQFGDALEVRDLAPEIAILRVKLNFLLNYPGDSPDLIIKTLQVLGSLMNIQRRCILRIPMSQTPFVSPPF